MFWNLLILNEIKQFVKIILNQRNKSRWLNHYKNKQLTIISKLCSNKLLQEIIMWSDRRKNSELASPNLEILGRKRGKTKEKPRKKKKRERVNSLKNILYVCLRVKKNWPHRKETIEEQMKTHTKRIQWMSRMLFNFLFYNIRVLVYWKTGKRMDPFESVHLCRLFITWICYGSEILKLRAFFK